MTTETTTGRYEVEPNTKGTGFLVVHITSKGKRSVAAVSTTSKAQRIIDALTR